MFGIVAYHRLTRWRSREERQIKAGQELITAFDKIKKAINGYDGHFYLLENLLLREFERQRIAAYEFRRHLGFVSRIRFNKAWNKYHGGNEDAPYFRQYTMSDNIQDLLLHRMNKILKFANKP